MKNLHETYELIGDLDILIEFINWIPELKPHERYFISLFGRKKYLTDEQKETIKLNDKQQLKTVITTKERLVKKIRQLEVKVGCYDTHKGVEIPQNALAIYITPTPRDLNKATVQTGKECWKVLNKVVNPVAIAKSAIQTSRSTLFVVDFDIDNVDADLQPLKDLLPNDSYRILKTRGGYHLIVQADIVNKNPKVKTWYIDIINLYGLNKNGKKEAGDMLLPIPGCYQGGYIPHFVTI